MTVQEAILNYLLSRGDVVNIVHNHIFTNHLPENPPFPSISIRLISAEHGRNLDGPNGVVRARVQVESWASDFWQSQDLGEQVRLAMQGYVGLMSSLDVRDCALDTDIDTPEPPEDASENWIYSKAYIFSVLYNESVPSHA